MIFLCKFEEKIKKHKNKIFDQISLKCWVFRWKGQTEDEYKYMHFSCLPCRCNKP
jgi:hypothetical protein